VITFDTSGNADITNKLRMPGTDAAIAIGVTPPTGPTAGTGIWLDRTGIFGLSSGTQQFYVDATTGEAKAGAGAVALGATGIRLQTIGSISVPESYPQNTVRWEESGSVRSYVYTTHDGGPDSAGTLILYPKAAGSGKPRIWLRGFSCLGGSASDNPYMTMGLTIDQGEADDEALAIKGSYVAHGMTDETETSTFFVLEKAEDAAGGARLVGYKDADGVAGVAAQLVGHLGENADTTKTTAARGIVELYAAIKSGTTIGDVNADGNLLTLRCPTRGTVLIVDEGGDLYYDGTASGYDAEDDIALIRELSEVLARDRRVRAMTRRTRVEALGIVYPDETGTMTSKKRSDALVRGALLQIDERLRRLEARL
jgi:hypothetical protein